MEGPMLLNLKENRLDRDPPVLHAADVLPVPPRRVIGSRLNLPLILISRYPGTDTSVICPYRGERLCWCYFKLKGFILTPHRGKF